MKEFIVSALSLITLSVIFAVLSPAWILIWAIGGFQKGFLWDVFCLRFVGSEQQ